MAGFRAMTMGAKVALVAGGAAIAALAGYGGWALNKSRIAAPVVTQDQVAGVAAAVPDARPSVKPGLAEPMAEPATASSAKGATPAVAAPAQPAVPAAVPAAEQPLIAPNFDVVRVEPDGSTVVAGRAEPGATIVLRVDGAEISATTADANGNFVGLFVLESSKAPRMLTMTSILPDKTEVPATATVALAPTQTPPVAVAADTRNAAPQTVSPPLADPDMAVAAADPTAPLSNTAKPTAAEPTATPAAPAETAALAGPAASAQAPAALLITKDGATVLQSGGATVATGPEAKLTIDAISYTPAGAVQLAGKAAPDAFVRIYLDTAPLIDVKVGPDGLWAATMPPIAPGIYILRADQLAADGSVTARFETPFKRETQEALAQAAKAPAPAAAVLAADAGASAEPVDPATDVPLAGAVASVSSTTIPDAKAAAVADQAASVKPAPIAPVSITVQPGFTLWGIATQQFGDGVLYVQVFEANKDKIRDPDLIYPGQVFVIPKVSN